MVCSIPILMASGTWSAIVDLNSSRIAAASTVADCSKTAMAISIACLTTRSSIVRGAEASATQMTLCAIFSASASLAVYSAPRFITTISRSSGVPCCATIELSTGRANRMPSASSSNSSVGSAPGLASGGAVARQSTHEVCESALAPRKALASSADRSVMTGLNAGCFFWTFWIMEAMPRW